MLSSNPQHSDLRGVGERCRIDWQGAEAGVGISSTIGGNRYQFFDRQIPVGTQSFQQVHIISSTDEQRIIHRHQPAAVCDQWADFIDQPCVLGYQIQLAFVRNGKEGRVEEDTIEKDAGPFEALITVKKSAARNSSCWIGKPFSV